MINSPEEYASLVDKDFKSARWVVASEDIWFSILNNFPQLKEEVVLNKKLPIAVIDLLSKDKNSRIRGFVARKRQLSYDIFMRLAFDNNESVRMGVAANVKTPIDVLKNMQSDSWNEIIDVVRERLSVAAGKGAGPKK